MTINEQMQKLQRHLLDFCNSHKIDNLIAGIQLPGTDRFMTLHITNDRNPLMRQLKDDFDLSVFYHFKIQEHASTMDLHSNYPPQQRGEINPRGINRGGNESNKNDCVHPGLSSQDR